MCWSFTEVVRFTYYTIKQVGWDQAGSLFQMAIGFLRYNGFWVLYPVGVSGELMCCYQVWLRLSQIENDRVKPFTLTLPNTYNFSFSFETFIKYGIPICYLNFPPMFMHMVR